MQPQHASSLSSFAGVVVVCSLIGRIFEHLARPNPDDIDSDPNSDCKYGFPCPKCSSSPSKYKIRAMSSCFVLSANTVLPYLVWRSHRKIDNILLNMVLHLPSHLRLPAGPSSSNTIFLNMTLQSATICLHQAAIAKAEKVGQGFGYETMVVESRARCAAAAHEIANIMKRIAHFDLSTVSIPLLILKSFRQLLRDRILTLHLQSIMNYLGTVPSPPSLQARVVSGSKQRNLDEASPKLSTNTS